jgi:DNA-binding transcriptional ArsR family regulator
MIKKQDSLKVLEKIFHEPNRMAIMSVLCAAEKGLSFNELKTACKLTDGNLSRHLKVIQQAGAVEIHKSFVADKPRTTVVISKSGLDRFGEYLGAIAEVLETARKALPAEKKKSVVFPWAETVKI